MISPTRFSVVWSCHTATASADDSAGDGGGRNPASTIQPSSTVMMEAGPHHTMSMKFLRSADSLSVGGSLTVTMDIWLLDAVGGLRVIERSDQARPGPEQCAQGLDQVGEILRIR